MPLRISNRDARRLWLNAQGLATAPTGALDLGAIIGALGMVQLDTIRVVARAHHHILWSRNQNYREPMLNHHMASERGVFEHFTHDASVLPMEFYPMWQRQFRRKTAQIKRQGWWKNMPDAAGRAEIRARIANEGPLSTHAFDSKVKGEKQMWQRPPHKLALDYMWYEGSLATSHRESFKKFYDLSERVIPRELLEQEHSDADQLDWLCQGALSRLAFATQGEIQRFWEAADAREVKAWLVQAETVAVDVECADGTCTLAHAPADIEDRLASLPAPTSRLRILSPFDPAVRDRARLSALFGFDYRIEIFVPAAKRKWGYYVYPLLEGDRFVGRIEVKADRVRGELEVINLWPEPKVKWTTGRGDKLEAELARLARFVGVERVVWR